MTMNISEVLRREDFVELGGLRLGRDKIIGFRLGANSYGGKTGVDVIYSGISGGIDGTMGEFSSPSLFFEESTDVCQEIYKLFDYQPENPAVAPETNGHDETSPNSRGHLLALAHDLAKPVEKESLKGLTLDELCDFKRVLRQRFGSEHGKDVQRICDTVSHSNPDIGFTIAEKRPEFLFSVRYGYGDYDHGPHYSVKYAGNLVFSQGDYTTDILVPGEWVRAIPEIVAMIDEDGRRVRQEQAESEAAQIIASVTGQPIQDTAAIF